MSDDEVLALARTRLGTVLRGKYRLDRILGVGGMAVVYAATHRNKKRFAIKMLHPELSGRENIRTRFLREGYVANTVEHSGAVAVLDDDIAEDGSAFVVMELLEGAPVDEVWARHGKRVPLGLALSIGDALLDVLAAAHAKGVVHRDIKPANLFLTYDGRLEVLDFGIARLHDATSASATQTGAMLGTPAYMAPEQALAEASKVDGQTDLWAVGATLFSLLTGELVHTGENASQFLVSAATKKAREVSSVSSEVPKKIASVIDKALAFDKTDRWASAKEMREALQTACLEVTGAPVASLPKTEKPAEPITGLEATMTPDFGPVPVSSGEAFDPTVNASAATSGAASGGGAISPLAATGAAVSKTQNEPATKSGRPVRWRAIGVGVLACAAVAGGVGAYRAVRGPRVRYCREILITADGPSCIAEVGAEVVGRLHGSLARFTEQAGKVTRLESVNPTGVVDNGPNGFARMEVIRDSAGSVLELVAYDRFGAIVQWQKWSDGGKRIDFVDVDGRTPRHASPSDRWTTERLEFDEQGRVTRNRWFGPTGRPRASGQGAYGLQYEYGKTPGVVTKTTSLGSDGAPAPSSDGTAYSRTADSRWGEQTFFDSQDRPASHDGYAIIRFLHDEYEPTGGSFHGLHGEPVTSLRQTVHEVRNTWDPAKRTYKETVFDEQGRPQVVRGLWLLAVRHTFDERGNEILAEFLDGQGNRVISLQGVAAMRTAFDQDGRLIRIEDLDPSGTLMTGSMGYARVERKDDPHGNPLEERHYDEAGHLAPWKEGGAIQRHTYDDRDLLLTTTNFDSEEHPAPNVRGFAAEHRKYDHLRNKIEVAYFGTDGKPTESDEGFATERDTYDENDDLVAVSYFDATGAPTFFESTYATKRLKNDERGLVVEESYFDVHADPVLMKAGYASVKKTRDRNGDVVEEAYFGKHVEPIVRLGGFALRKTSFDVMRRPIEVALFDTTGTPVVGSAGWSVERTTYDDRGLITRVDHLDVAKGPLLDRAGRASLTKVWDSRGNVTEETSLDVAGKPVSSTEGFARKKTTYDERDEVVEEELFDADGKPVSGKVGWGVRRLRYDDFGDTLEEAFFDGAHEPVVPKDLAYSSKKQGFDERHRLAETSYFDVRGVPTKGPEGVSTVRYKRDGYGRAVETSYFDGAGAGAPAQDGHIVVRSKYDDAGRLVDERFVDTAGAPRPGSDGCAGRHTKFDPQGHKLEEACLDANDSPTLSTDGWALRRTLHDAHGDDVDVATYAPDGKLRAGADGIARRKNRFDERNLLVETAFFDANEKPVHDKGGACSMRFTYDDTGKKTGETRFDATGREILLAKK